MKRRLFFSCICLLVSATAFAQVPQKPLSPPLVTDLYSADPSAHVFDGTIYIYPSHDIDAGVPENDNGDHFDMRDYHVYSLTAPDKKIKDHGVVLDIKQVPWAGKQLWAPDAAFRKGTYYLYFPAKDKQGVFRIGVATSKSPAGPFKALPEPVKGSYSIDPCVFTDDNGASYMYFGGIWGGQLQRWRTGQYNESGALPQDQEPAVGPRMAKLTDAMTEFAEPVRELKIVDADGKELLNGDNNRRFFEAAWMHKYKGKYYLSYSTGDTHLICYATGDNPYGPFVYRGVVLKPVLGWTNHHSIIEFKGKWYLFYHDSTLSGGKTHLRNIKMTELKYNADGTIQTITPYLD
jgi:hypothetical protein